MNYWWCYCATTIGRGNLLPPGMAGPQPQHRMSTVIRKFAINHAARDSAVSKKPVKVEPIRVNAPLSSPVRKTPPTRYTPDRTVQGAYTIATDWSGLTSFRRISRISRRPLASVRLSDSFSLIRSTRLASARLKSLVRLSADGVYER